VSPILESCIFLVCILGAAGLGMAGGLLLPEQHVDERARTHVFGSISVVATLTALLLGLMISTAQGDRVLVSRDLQDLSASVIRLDRLLRTYGPDADGARSALRSYVAHKRDDLFPTTRAASPNPGNLATVTLLDHVQDAVLALQPRDPAQEWRKSQALQRSAEIASAPWAIAEEDQERQGRPVVIVVTFWMGILFAAYGMFTPRHATAIAVLLLTALAVTSAIFVILEASSPFSGLIHIPSTPLDEAVALVRR
jgi:hypothetical protein